MTTAADYTGWAISITSTPYQGGELGNETGYTQDQIAAMRARLDDLIEQAVRAAFPGAAITFRAGGSDSINVWYDGPDGIPWPGDAHEIEAWVQDTMDQTFNRGAWTEAPRPRGYQFWRHLPDGEVFAVRLTEDAGEVNGVCGPLHHSEIRYDLIDGMNYTSEDVDWVTANIDRFVPVEPDA